MERPAKRMGPRRKMGMPPKGARPLGNPVGTAPGVLIEKGPTTIISLPGVPREMEAIFRESVIPLLEKSGGRGPIGTTLKNDRNVESAVAPAGYPAKRPLPRPSFYSPPRARQTTRRPL